MTETIEELAGQFAGLLRRAPKEISVLTALQILTKACGLTPQQIEALFDGSAKVVMKETEDAAGKGEAREGEGETNVENPEAKE